MVINIRGQQIQITSIMASGKEDVFTLVILHEEAKHLTDLVVRILLLIACIDEIEEIMCACEVRTEGT